MTYSPATIANYFLDKASVEQRALTPMQLLKLVYIAHGWNLGYFSEPLINETVQAWKYGPVIKSLYDKVKRYGSGAVSEPLRTGSMPWVRESSVDERTASLLNAVWRNYAQYSGIQLSRMTHQNETPWSQAWLDQGGCNQRYAEISNELIEKHYKAKILEVREASAA
jgi:uncharacterized phage-associated protein